MNRTIAYRIVSMALLAVAIAPASLAGQWSEWRTVEQAGAVSYSWKADPPFCGGFFLTVKIRLPQADGSSLLTFDAEIEKFEGGTSFERFTIDSKYGDATHEFGFPACSGMGIRRLILVGEKTRSKQ